MILLLGGTSDARELAAELRHAGYDVLLSTASDYGARLAEGAQEAGAAVRSGALTPAELADLVASADAVVDATHPFAQVISSEAAAACARAGRPYLRVERPAVELPPAAVSAADAAEAAALAVQLAAAPREVAGGGPRAATGDASVAVRRSPGAVLLTVGSKTVAEYVAAGRAAGVRVVARVLPAAESLRACAAAGLEPRDVIAMQGPTSAELDAALLRHLSATVLVTKDSGDAGGLREKLRAAELAGATAVVVARPAEPAAGRDGGAEPAEAARAVAAQAAAHTSAEVLAWLAKVASPTLEAAGGRGAHLRRGLLHVYTGDGKGKTTAAAGLALRALGAGLAVTVVQFVKGGRESSELAPLRAAGAHVVRPAVARSGLLRGAATEEDRAAAAAAWAAARAALSDPGQDLVVLDELHAALRHGLVELAEVLAALTSRPSRQEAVTTGRGAPDELVAAADLVTEMTPVRHPYPEVPARRGVEL